MPLVPNRRLILATALMLGGLCGPLAPALSAAELDLSRNIDIALPAQVELGKLTDLVGELVGVSIQYNPQRLRGTVNLTLRGSHSVRDLWQIYGQVLANQGFCTIVTGEPPVYQVVALGEAAGLSAVSPRETLDEESSLVPSFVVAIHELEHLAPEPAMQAVNAVLASQHSQVRVLGKDTTRIVMLGLREKVREALRILTMLDRPAITPAFRQYQPRFATPQKLQTAVNAAWNAAARVAGRESPIEIQLTPDGTRLLMITTAENATALVALAQELDESEPVQTQTYRPGQFAIADVAQLLEQVLQGEEASERLRIVRDELTDSLIISATSAQHQRVATILADLDSAPAAVRRVMRSFVVKHRKATDMAEVVRELVSAGFDEAGSSGDSDNTQAATTTTQIAPPAENANAEQAATATTEEATPAPRQQRPAAGGETEAITISVDEPTNTMIALGPPRLIAQVEALVAELDERQPQVELEISMVIVSESESRDIGIELVGLFKSSAITGNLGSLFGVGPTFDSATDPSQANGDFSGLGGMVIQPGDYSTLIRAVETLSEGESVITSRIVVDNNSDAVLNALVQEPTVNVNTNNSVAFTSIGQASEAGTQITITPQISAADHVTLTYAIGQSTFIGESTTTADGAVIPPPRRSDDISSVATIPDGHVIALGGLANRNEGEGETRVPFLGALPFIGNLFKRKTNDANISRFYVFIRANVLRHPNYEDLKYLSRPIADEAKVDDGWPILEPRFID